MTIYNLQPGDTQPIAYAASGQRNPPITEYTITNLDTETTIYIGAADASAQQPDLTTDLSRDQLAPLQSVTVRSTLDWFALNPSTDVVQVDVIPEGIVQSTSPVDAALAFITAGVPIAIAQQLSQAGISLVSAPVPLYQAPPVTPAAQLCTVGSNVSSATYSSPGTGPGNIAKWVSVTGEPLDVRRVELSTLSPNISNTFSADAAAGRLVVVSFSPTLGTGPNPTAQMLTDQATLNSTLAAMVAAGVNARIILYHEPSTSSITVPQYLFSVPFYAPTVQQYYPLDFGWSVGTSAKEQQYAAYFINGLFNGVMGDFYCRAYVHGGVLTGTNLSGLAALADNNTVAGSPAPLPFGMGEWGWNPNRDLAADIITYYTYLADPVTGFFPGRATGGKVNSYLCWFNPPGWNPTDSTTLSSTISAGGSQITGYQEVFNNCDTASSASSANLPAGTTVTLPPANPSPVGGLAPCLQDSYDLALDLIAGASSTKPFCRVTLTFFDFDATTANQVPVDEMKFIAPMGTSPNPAKTICTGPQSGAFMSAQVRSLDTVPATLSRFQLIGSSRTKPRHDPRWDAVVSPQAIPTYTLVNSGVPYSLMLGDWTPAALAPSGGTASALISMFAGEVFVKLSVQASGSIGNNNVRFTIIPQPTSEWGGSAILSALLPNPNSANPNEFEGFVALPRGPCLVTVVNNDSTATVTAIGAFIAVEQ